MTEQSTNPRLEYFAGGGGITRDVGISESDKENDYLSNITKCQTPNKEAGLCIKLLDCSHLFDMVKNPSLNESGIDYLRKSHCGFFKDDVKVCCPSNEDISNISLTTEFPFSTESSNKDLEDDGSKIVYINNNFPTPGTCGISISAADRIYGGKKAELGDFPWIVLLGYETDEGQTEYHCEGSLITDRYVLTAGHCLVNLPMRWKVRTVRLGEWDLSQDVDCFREECTPPPIDIKIETIIIHPRFNKSTLANDIALLRLHEKVKYSEYVKPICLPITDELETMNYTNQNLEIAGWGKTEYSISSNVKLIANIQGGSLEKCKEIYEKYDIEITTQQFCAGGVINVDACIGDSGGPSVGYYAMKGTTPYYFLAGIISFGLRPCGQSEKPGVYTRVASYNNWIRANVKDE